MLFDFTRHEPLTQKAWNEEFVLDEISFIIDDIENSLLPEACWPTHPLDAQSYPNKGPKWASYAGAAGTINALQILNRYGYQTRYLSYLLKPVYTSFLQNPDFSIEPGLQMGEIGILIPSLLAQPDNQKIKNRLIECMNATIKMPLYEITSGQTGMMHAALHLYQKTHDPCWKTLFIQGAQSLMENWICDNNTGEWLWQSQVFGPKRHYYGACHGIVGNINILLQGAHLLPDLDTQLLIDRTITTLNLSAKKCNEMTNWSLCTKPTINKSLVQWCHGAAGIVTAMARTSTTTTKQTESLNKLLKSTGELVWYAGPLVKGANICHGTAGNGYAFLYLYQRWNDELWLNRARQFAMHAIEQSRKARQQYHQGRYTLWTGDAGLAIYLHHCIQPEKTALPGLDIF